MKRLLTLITLALILLAFSLPAMGTTKAPGYYVVLPGDAPSPGRAAPYGQYVVSHSNQSITTTEKFGTVKTAGYDVHKVLVCTNSSTGDAAQVNLYGRVTSTGSMYTLKLNVSTVPTSTGTWTAFEHNAPWLTLGITTSNAVTASVVTCGIYEQTP